MKPQRATTATLRGISCATAVFRNFFCILAWSLLVDPLTFAQTPDSEATANAEASADHLPSSITSASNSVVRIEVRSSFFSSGVIVSEQGHVIWAGSASPLSDMTAVLPSGESVPAKNLGWSSEWQIGLCKLDVKRKWPHAEFGSTVGLTPGEPCFEIGFHATGNKHGEFGRSPDVRPGKVSFVSPSHWFATDLKPTDFEYGAGTFNRDGKLLGISVPGVSTEHHLSTAIEIVTAHWQPLAEGKNLDWNRYPPSKHSLYRRLAAPHELERTGSVSREQLPDWREVNGPAAINEDEFRTAQKIAAATTVRIIQKKDKNNCWSGVIVSPEGHITTCAHTHQVAGEELVVVLPDSREVPAVALGTNWVSDIGLVKITEEGPWEYADLGDSSLIGPEGAVLCAGFPVPHTIPLPPVTTGVYPLQQTPYVGWNHQLMVDMDFKLSGGASGGGIFDSDGRLVGVYLGRGGHRIEMFRAQLEDLNREKPLAVSKRISGSHYLERPSLSRSGCKHVGTELGGRVGLISEPSCPRPR